MRFLVVGALFAVAVAAVLIAGCAATPAASTAPEITTGSEPTISANPGAQPSSGSAVGPTGAVAGAGPSNQPTPSCGTVATPPNPAAPPSNCQPSAHARQLAAVLLSSAIVPPGATPAPENAAGSASRPDVEPASPTLASASALWSVPLGQSATLAYLDTHVPAGFAITGHGSFSGRDNGEMVIESATPLPAGLCFAQLVFSLQPTTATRTQLRVDGQAMDNCAAGPHN